MLLDADALRRRATAEEVLFREARHLDLGEWERWLAMYSEDAVYWIPAWLDEYELCTDPDRQVSLVYHSSRAGLAERIARIESRKSITALPLPRTVHRIGNVVVLAAEDGMLSTDATFAVHVYDSRVGKSTVHFGRYGHSLNWTGSEWQITRKTITLVNDRIPTVLDFYSI